MCGRVASSRSVDALAGRFGVEDVRSTSPPSWNAAPTMPLPVVHGERGGRHLEAMAWGLVPPWSRDGSGASRHINARAETVHERPVFAAPFRYRRALVVIDGFYEWRRRPGWRSEPWYITRQDGDVLALAGLWEAWADDEGPHRTCAIITVAAGPVVAPLHDRQPLAIPEVDWDAWLDWRADADVARILLERAVTSDPWRAWPVGPAVGDVRNDHPGLTAEVPAAPEGTLWTQP